MNLSPKTSCLSNPSRIFKKFAMSEQYSAIKTYAKAGKMATEAYNLLKTAYGDKALSRTRVFDWFKQFKEGREDAESRVGKDTPCRVRIDENIRLVENLIQDDKFGKFLDHLRKKRPEKLEAGWILHQDNARPHTSKEIMALLAKRKVNVLPHAPYSPELAPFDFWLFLQLKAKLAGHSYDTEMELKVAAEGVLRQLCHGGLQHSFEAG